MNFIKAAGFDWKRAHALLSRLPFSVFLAGSSLLYGLVMRTRTHAYQHGVLKQKKLRGFVLSVGNITVGGTGKTPAVIMLAEWAVAEGYSVCVLSRGYGGKYSDSVLEVSDGDRVKVRWEGCGDEPFLLAHKLRGVPVVVSRSRFAAGTHAITRFGSNFFVLDDGFQHLSLARDFDLVLMDSEKPFGNERLLPWGLLREPKDSIGRASAIILTGHQFGKTWHELNIEPKFSRIPRFWGSHYPEAFLIPSAGIRHEPSFLREKKVVAFAGIGRPASFEKTLSDLGAEVVSFKAFPDHHVYREGEIRDLEQMRAMHGCEFLVTTEKDWTRAKDLITEKESTGYISIRFMVNGNAEELFQLIKDAAQRKFSELGERDRNGV